MRHMDDRARTRVILAALLAGTLGLAVVVLVSAPTSSQACVTSTDYGKQCETIARDGLRLTGIEADFTFVPDFLDQHVWTFETTIYKCDPRGNSKHDCAPAKRAYGSRHPRSPNNTAANACTREGTVVAGNGCSGTLNFKLPRTFKGSHWVCVEIAVRVKGAWVDNGSGDSNGHRACQHVH